MRSLIGLKHGLEFLSCLQMLAASTRLGAISVPVFVLLTIVRLVLAGPTGPFCARGSIRPLVLAGSCVINQGIVAQILLHAKANE